MNGEAGFNNSTLYRQQAILDHEEARLEFALDWLELILFGKSENIEIKA